MTKPTQTMKVRTSTVETLRKIHGDHLQGENGQSMMDLLDHLVQTAWERMRKDDPSNDGIWVSQDDMRKLVGEGTRTVAVPEFASAIHALEEAREESHLVAA